MLLLLLPLKAWHLNMNKMLLNGLLLLKALLTMHKAMPLLLYLLAMLP